MHVSPFSAPSQRDETHKRNLATAAVVVVACVLAVVLLSNFVDALHQSIARGEALRETQRMAGISAEERESGEAIAQANLLMARR